MPESLSVFTTLETFVEEKKTRVYPISALVERTKFFSRMYVAVEFLLYKFLHHLNISFRFLDMTQIISIRTNKFTTALTIRTKGTCVASKCVEKRSTISFQSNLNYLKDYSLDCNVLNVVCPKIRPRLAKSSLPWPP